SKGFIDSRSFLLTIGGEWLRCLFEYDITEKKRMETQLVQGQKMQAVGQLVGGIAHDFNNLLCGILGYAEVLTEKLKGNPRELKYAKTIFRTAKRATTLTGQLLSFSHNKDYVLEPMDVHDCINETVRLLVRSIDKRIIIRRDLNAGESVIIGDTTQLQNAFLNLGINARDAMPEGGLLVISTELVQLGVEGRRFGREQLPPGEYIQIQFTDNGVGMDEETAAKIFDPFFTTKEIGEGTGLGLAAVYGTIQKHMGGISVSSQAGTGSDFRILLPLEREAAIENGDFDDDLTAEIA
ncbi:MAG: hypothetical protein F6K39_40230, partial [Okeania sp. SIO3B3]|nr:hypothetical protein [Okeania sp. SIO3B3]